MSRAKTAKLQQNVRDVVVDGEQCSSPPDCDQIREAAYFKWEAAGRPCGDGVEYWLAAEVEQASMKRPSKPRWNPKTSPFTRSKLIHIH
jgi:hypothetical protein